MAGEINWKSKYQEVKAKWMESVDMAFRIGFEEGLKQSQLDQVSQQMAQQQQLAGMQAGAEQPTEQDPSQDAGDQGQGPTQPAGPGKGIEEPESENPDGSELDQHIARLEGMISKSEQIDAKDLIGTVSQLKGLQKSQLEQLQLRKSAQAIPAIAKALHKPAFKMSQQANHNLNGAAKQAVSMQQKIVTDIMAKWEAEENKVSKDILSQLSIEGLTKKED